MILETPRLSLRCYEPEDFSALHAILSDPVTMQHIDGQAMPEIGYHIHRGFWRQGYGGEAACAVRDWGFTHTDFPALYSYMTQGNTASRATAAHMGMRLIHSFHDAYYQDMVVYAITRDAWQTLKASGDTH